MVPISVQVSYDPLGAEKNGFFDKLLHKIHQPVYFFTGAGSIISSWILSVAVLATTGFGLWLYIAGSGLFLFSTYLLVRLVESHFFVLPRELLSFRAGEDYLEFKTWEQPRRVDLKETKKIEIKKDRKFQYLGLLGDCQLGRIEVETWRGEKLLFNILLVFRGEKNSPAGESFEELVDFLGDHLYYRERTSLPER